MSWITRTLDRSGVRWTLGVGLPLAMLLFDPAVFRSTAFGVGLPLLGRVKPSCYTATGIALCAFALWMLRPRSSGLLSGVFVGCAVFAGVLGIVLLPFSLLGTVFCGVGLLGFTPFLMSVVYGRVAKCAFPTGSTRGRAWVGLLLGAILFLGVPAGVQWAGSEALSQSVADIRSKDPSRNERGFERLRRWYLLLDLDLLVAAYKTEWDIETRTRIGEAYHQLTGRDVKAHAALID